MHHLCRSVGSNRNWVTGTSYSSEEVGIQAIASVEQTAELDDQEQEGESHMTERSLQTPPRLLFAILAVGGFIACGIYLGMIRAGQTAPGHIILAAIFGVFGILMMWGVLGRR